MTNHFTFPDKRHHIVCSMLMCEYDHSFNDLNKSAYKNALVFCTIHNHVSILINFHSFPEHIKKVLNDDPSLIFDYLDSNLPVQEWFDSHQGLIVFKKFGL